MSNFYAQTDGIKDRVINFTPAKCQEFVGAMAGGKTIRGNGIPADARIVVCWNDCARGVFVRVTSDDFAPVNKGQRIPEIVVYPNAAPIVESVATMPPDLSDETGGSNGA